MSAIRAKDGLDQLRDLLDHGFAVVNVDSTDQHVVVSLSDGRVQRAIALGPDEVIHLLSRDTPLAQLIA